MSQRKTRKGAKRSTGPTTATNPARTPLRVASTEERNRLTELHRRGDFERACELARSIVERCPDDAFAWTVLGSSLIKLKAYEEALQALTTANSLFPGDYLILDALARAHAWLGNHAQAIVEQRRCLELEPQYAAGHFQLAVLLYDSGDMQALEHLDKAEALGHDLAEVLSLRGSTQSALLQFNAALTSFRKLLEIKPDDHFTQNNIANIYKDMGEFAKAEEAYRKAMALNPGYVAAYSNLFFSMHYDPARTPESILAFARDWEKRFTPPYRLAPPAAASLVPDKRLRVGLLSSGLRQHPVGQMITAALEHLDDGIELYAYSTNNVQDAITARIRKTVAAWQPVSHLGEPQLAEKIRQDGIDILIDLSGHGSGNRLRSIAMRPAPLAVKWVGGLVGSMGLESFDYLLSDSIETPAGVDHLYVEKLIRMPDDYICYLPPAPLPPITALPAIANGHITLGCFNNPAKINPVLLAEWARLMHELPDCRLLLKGAQYDSPEFCERIRGIMREHGIAAERLTLEGPAGHTELLATYNRIDIALDPWPYSGGLTTCEAMLMGVPVVTFPGPTFAGRHSATHLVNAGMPELVVASWDEYRQRVIELANDWPNLSVIRACLRQILLQSPVCDGARFARHLTTALRAIWQRHCAGQAPAALALGKDGTARFDDEARPVELAPVGQDRGDDGEAFRWDIAGKIVTLDHGALLATDPIFPGLQKLDAFATIAFDPAGRLDNAQVLQGPGELHHYPRVTLGDGEPTTLHVCRDPAMSATLPPLHEAGDGQVIATQPIHSLRLDDIEGLEHIDWLLLDNLSDSLKILANGEKALGNVLLVQARVSFAPTHRQQPELTPLSHWLSRHGFSFYRLGNHKHIGHLPERGDLLRHQATQLASADALFIPDTRRMAGLTDEQRLKLAFVLHTVHGIRDLAYALLSRADKDRSHAYLVAEGFLPTPERSRPADASQPAAPAEMDAKFTLPDAPRMSAAERNLFRKAIGKATSYFEFGSGGSTVWAIQAGLTVKGVESDARWVDALKDKLGERCQVESVDIGPTGAWGYPVSMEHSENFQNYSRAIQGHDLPFDLILVDGRFRVACTIAAIQHVLDHHQNPESAEILIHDFWDRPQYHAVLEFLDPVEKAETAGLFRIKPSLERQTLESTWAKYASQPA